MTAGVLALVAAPTAVFASPNTKTTDVKVVQYTAQAGNRYALPKSSLYMNPPPQIPESQRPPAVTDILGRAFNRDDLNSLYGAGGFGSCETSSRIPSFFEKNYSNFVASCIDEFRSKQAISFDERFNSNPESQGIATSPLGGGMQWTRISAGARERLLQRSINDLAKKNKTLADIIQGRISFNFGLGQFFSKDSSVNAAPQSPKPRYVVEVIEPASDNLAKNRALVASVGRLPEGSLRKEGMWYSEKPKRARRILRETFEESAPVAVRDESLVPSNQASQSNNASETVSSLRYVSRLAGLSDLPFSKMNMRAERRLVDGKNQFALRAGESQDLFFAEIPDIRKPTSGALVWGYKIPWKQHAVAVRVDESIREKVTSYSYKIDDQNRSDLNYNHKDNSVSAGFSISF
jgi:hypothetical protein